MVILDQSNKKKKLEHGFSSISGMIFL